MAEALPRARGIIFVVNGSQFKEELRVVADLLYSVLLKTLDRATPILLVCTKQVRWLCFGCLTLRGL